MCRLGYCIYDGFSVECETSCPYWMPDENDETEEEKDGKTDFSY